MEWKRILGYGDEASVYGLAFVFLAAGASKFLAPELWMGYEPAWMRSLTALSAEQFVFVTGLFEAALGAAIASRFKRWLTGTIATVWLLMITVTVASLEMWTIALRDLGLAVLAYSVASRGED